MRARLPLAALLAAASLIAVAPAGAAGLPGAPVALGQFSGYLANLPKVSSVGATIVVPRIRPHTKGFAFAASWIGAQAPGRHAPFIQIGVTESHIPIKLRGQRALYYAFWSDTRRHFRATVLFGVRAGDTVAVSLRRMHDGWKLAIADATSGVSRRFFTHDEARGAFNLAEWLQEDPTNSSTHGPLPYPGLSGAHFGQLRVNSRRPPLLLSTWMTLHHGYRGPIAQSRDSFTVRPLRLGAAAARFWRLARPDDAAATAFYEAQLGWSAATPRAAIAHASGAYAREIRANIALLANPAWPPRLRRDAHALIRRQEALLHLVEASPRQFSRAPTAWRTRYAHDSRAVSGAGLRLREHVHGPELAG